MSLPIIYMFSDSMHIHSCVEEPFGMQYFMLYYMCVSLCVRACIYICFLWLMICFTIFILGSGLDMVLIGV